MEAVVGIDVGGTSARLGLFERRPGSFDLVLRFEIEAVPTGERSEPEAVLRAVWQSLMRRDGVRPVPSAIGLAVPGLVNGGVMVASSNLPNWVGCDVISLLQHVSQMQAVAVANDVAARTAYLASIHAGPASDGSVRTMLSASIGTGLGVHYFDGKQVITRGLGMGEVGHALASDEGWAPSGMPHERCVGWAARCADPNGRRRGVVEQTVSGPGIVALYNELSGGGARSAQEVAAAATAGNEAAIAAFAYAGHVLANAIAPVRALLNPNCIVLCGGVARSASLLIPSLERRLAQHCFPDAPEFAAYYVCDIFAAIESDGLAGAAAIALSALEI